MEKGFIYRTRRWDPARHITDGAAVLTYLQAIAAAEYDPDATPFLLDCIARSAGIADIARVDFHETDAGTRCVTVATAAGQEVTIAIADAVSIASVRNALSPQCQPAAISA